MKAKLLPIFFLLLLAASRPVFAQAQPGIIRVTTTLHSDGTKTVMQTNADEHTAESTTYNQAEKVMQRIVFALDDRGLAMSGKLLSAKGVVLSNIEYKYDGMNRVTEVATSTPDKKLVSRQVYHYDGNNRVTGIDTFDAAGNLISTTSKQTAAEKKKKSQSQNVAR